MRDVVASLAVTLDMFVSRPDGDVQYLDEYMETGYDFEAFAATIGGLVMGSTSYEQAVGWGWMWGDRPTVVMTSRSDLPVPDGADITFSSGSTAEETRALAERIDGRVWVFGGGRVVTDGLLGGAVDTLDIAVMPEAIGEGIPLFAEPYDGTLELLTAIPYDLGMVRLVYRTSDRQVERPDI